MPLVRTALMIEGQEGVTWQQWVALAQTAEQAGIEALFRSDHYSTVTGRSGGSLDAWTTLAGLAAVTERLRLGTLVSPATFRHPSLLARAVATVDHISGGRAELGMGAGWMEQEHRAFGFPFPPYEERAALLAEQIEIVHRQWTEDRFTFHGDDYELFNCEALPKPVQRPHPPLLVGGKGRRRTLEVAARWADEYNAFHVEPEFFRDLRRRLDEALAAAGREPGSVRLSLMTPLDGWTAELQREYEAAGVERVFLQHLDHEDLGAVERLGRDLG
jgi:F420-dependent oxidoreductase-like protein